MTNPDTNPVESPVFVVGPLRSGSTLLRLVLDHHPDFFIFGEFEGAVSQAVGDEWPELSAYHQFSRHDRQMKTLGFEIDESLAYEELVHSFLEQMKNRSAKQFIGACVHSRIDMLPRLWPHARFIHILRDPRDVARSAIGMGWVGNVYEGARYWMQPERHWDLLCQQVPDDQLFELRYEDFVEEPERYCIELCEFLGVPYDRNMLDIGRDTTYSRPDPAFSYQWKKKQTEKEIAWVEYQCGEKLKQRGYELSGNPIRKPGMLERLFLKVQSRIFRLLFNIRRWGLWLWLQHVISKRVGTETWRVSVQKKIDMITLEHLR